MLSHVLSVFIVLRLVALLLPDLQPSTALCRRASTLLKVVWYTGVRRLAEQHHAAPLRPGLQRIQGPDMLRPHAHDAAHVGILDSHSHGHRRAMSDTTFLRRLRMQRTSSPDMRTNVVKPVHSIICRCV